MENKRSKIVKMFLLAVMAVCLILIGQAYCQFVQHRAQQEELRKMVRELNVEYLTANDGALKGISVSASEFEGTERGRWRRTAGKGIE